MGMRVKRDIEKINIAPQGHATYPIFAKTHRLVLRWIDKPRAGDIANGQTNIYGLA
jgi:hypothetical protein